ncbi:MAG: DUF456 domain-containing protein [Planctomycetota bacterium]
MDGTWGDVAVWFAALCVIGVAWFGVAMVAVTLPGIWTMAAAALLVEWIAPDVLSIWVVLAVIGLGVVGELVEFYASMAGSKRAGGSRAGGWGALVGTIVGLIVGQIVIPIPLAGAIVGGIVGAGLGAALSERGVAKRSWVEALRSGRGASTGRALSMVFKTAIAVIAASALTINAAVAIVMTFLGG